MRLPQLGGIPAVDVAGAVLLLGAAGVETATIDTSASRLLLGLLAVCYTVPVAWRRRAPFTALVIVLVALSLAGEVDPGGTSFDHIGFAALVVALYSVAAYAGRRTALVGLATVLAFFTLGTLVDNYRSPGSRPVGDLAYMAVLNTVIWGLGRIVRRWREQARALAQRTAELEEEREWRALAAVAEERTRIARELHDVIAHSVSVMVIQAAAAEQMLAVDPDRVRAPLSSIQEVGRQAVLELRTLLGMLRPADEVGELAPQPSLRNVGSLIEQSQGAGMSVELRLEGVERELAPGIELAAYRVVQEALTNVLKHAGAAAAEVTIRYEPDALDLEVLDHGGRPQEGAGDGAAVGSGRGLTGMRERLAMYGGELSAGPNADGGFAVRARLPLRQPGA